MYNVVASRVVDDDQIQQHIFICRWLVVNGKEQEGAREEVKSRSLSEFVMIMPFSSHTYAMRLNLSFIGSDREQISFHYFLWTRNYLLYMSFKRHLHNCHLIS
jgi:hypothetical protein